MFTKKSILFQLLLMLIVADGCQVVLTGTAPPNETLEPFLIDQSLLSDFPCKAPCWYGLELGRSNESDIQTTLHTLSFVDLSSLQETTVNYWDSLNQNNIRAKLISIGCIEPNHQQCVGLTLVDDKLKVIGLFPNYSITFREVVEHLGIPDYISAHLVPPTYSPSCSIRLIWMERQIIIDHNERTSTELCTSVKSGLEINPNLTVDAITYVMPDDIQLLSVPEFNSDFPWVGFSEP